MTHSNTLVIHIYSANSHTYYVGQQVMGMRLLKQIDISGILSLHSPTLISHKDICNIFDFLIINPLTAEPYIPGSSILDRLNFLLFKYYGDKEYKKLSCQLFPPRENEENKLQAPARLVVRDALPVETTYEKFKKIFENNSPVEIIKRIKNGMPDGRWNKLSPLEFHLQLGLRIYEDSRKNEKKLLEFVIYGLHLMEQFGLNECGQLTITNLEIDGHSVDNSFIK